MDIISAINTNGIVSSFFSSEFWFSPDLARTLFPYKIIFIIVGICFIVFIMFVMQKTGWLRVAFLENLVEFLTFHSYGAKKIDRDWERIMGRLEKGSESDYKLSVIEADELLDSNLKKMGYTGKVIDDRLEQLKGVISNLDELQDVHKVRNDIVHDPNYKLSRDKTKSLLVVYERAFHELQIF